MCHDLVLCSTVSRWHHYVCLFVITHLWCLYDVSMTLLYVSLWYRYVSLCYGYVSMYPNDTVICVSMVPLHVSLCHGYVYVSQWRCPLAHSVGWYVLQTVPSSTEPPKECCVASEIWQFVQKMEDLGGHGWFMLPMATPVFFSTGIR